MKTTLAVILAVGAGCVLGGVVVSHRLAARHAADLAERQAAWQAERARLEAALEEALERACGSAAPPVVSAAPAAARARLSPTEVIARLQELRPVGGAAPAQMRQALYWLEELVQTGPAALPAIREFLARNEDIEFDTTWLQSRAAREGRLPADFLLPPSLRLGLMDVVRRIGGASAERVLADTLNATGRGLEVAYLTRLLHEMAPNRHREAALAAAYALLAGAAPLDSASPLDRYHRDCLFGVLLFYGDTGFSREAAARLVGADAQVDRGALKYLQQTLGAQAVPIAAQAYLNPLLTNSASKEPLARLALNFVGADARADEFYQQAINDPLLTRDHRRNLIEDLNQDGFPDPRNLTANDLLLVQRRLAFIERSAPKAMDPVNAAAFKEAYKDLVNMRAKIVGQTAPAGTPPPAQP
jgi:hypothetical protein